MKKNLIKAGQVLFIVFVAGLLLIWLNQSSLERFWQQKYHRDTPWSAMSGNPIWDYGAYLNDGVQAAGSSFLYHASGQQALEAKQNEALAQNNNEKQSFPEGYQVGLHFINGYIYPAKSLSITFPERLKRQPSQGLLKNVTLLPEKMSSSAPIIPKEIAQLKKGEEVLFAGDSMMQGVAPHVKNMLLKKYNINSINLSKQSTGLAYPRFFNWPKTIANTLDNNPNIKVLVVFLGPNDPWDMPGDSGYKYVKFKSGSWEQMYRSRINDILTVARQHNVDVIWVGPPNMRKATLSDGMQFLRGLYQSEVENNGEIYFSVNDVFKYKDNTYSDYFGDDSSKIKLRSGDGIHFSPKGQLAIAEKVFSLIHFEEAQEEKVSHDTEKVASN
ncbi:peptidoglycan O-acyl transferase [Providencia sneebia DSM 19967]|uniref:Peptidoglycan O-acyl transferase n=1 Tax=Providencia sneebia DSM 19967 TaxID=1141660 RepID=K8VZX2_9GAMM|nr:peptidoglycan O-acyl transferase [Providencia sneebia DSM 19967]